MLKLDSVSPLPDSVLEFVVLLVMFSEIKRFIFLFKTCGDYEKYSGLDLSNYSTGLTGE
jgi:hypothetical protein